MWQTSGVSTKDQILSIQNLHGGSAAVFVSLLVVITCTACGKKPEEPRATRSPAPPMTPPTMGARTKPMTPAKATMAKSVAPKSGMKNLPEASMTKVPAAPLTKEDFKATVPTPSYGVINKIMRVKGREHVSAWGIKPLGGARFATVVSGRNTGKSAWWFVLLVLEKQASGWTELYRFPIDASPFGGNQGKGRVGAELHVGDFDTDGRPEAKVTYRFPTGDSGDGEIRKIAFINLGVQKATLAARLLIADTCEVCPITQKGYLTLKDLNGDTHADLEVTRGFYLTAQVKDKGTKRTKKLNYRRRITWLYDQKSDTYKPQWSKERLPPSMRFSFAFLGIEPGNSLGMILSRKNEDTGCLELSCLGPWGFPAIARNGTVAAFLASPATLPSWLPAPGFAEGSEGVFHLVNMKTGKLVKRIDIVDSGIQASAYAAAQDMTCLNEVAQSGEGDPRLCERDPKKVPAAIAAAKASIKSNIKKIAAELYGLEFAPLLTMRTLSNKVPPPTQGFALTVTKVKENQFLLTVTSFPDAKEVVRHTYTSTHPRVDAVGTWSRHFRTIIIQIYDAEPPENTSFAYIIKKIPPGVLLPTAPKSVPQK